MHSNDAFLSQDGPGKSLRKEKMTILHSNDNFMTNDYYTYAYLRKDKTPYYIGKGIGNRAFVKRKGINPPRDISRILFLKKNLTETEAFKHEVYMIDVLGRKDLGTGILHNRTDGGEGTSGRIQSEETKNKISEANKGKTLTEEHRKKCSEASRGNTNMLGKKHSEESKRKMSEARTGVPIKPFSEEHKRRIGEANAGEKNGCYGRCGEKNHQSKKVLVVYPDGNQKTFESIKSVTETLGCDKGTVRKHCLDNTICLRGKCKNLSFSFLTENND